MVEPGSLAFLGAGERRVECFLENAILTWTPTPLLAQREDEVAVEAPGDVMGVVLLEPGADQPVLERTAKRVDDGQVAGAVEEAGVNRQLGVLEG